MLLLGPNCTDSDHWTARARICAYPDEVLHALTDPRLIAAWAPVNFAVEGLTGTRLCAGSRARVTGSLAGVGTAFDVQVHRADADGLELVAEGPVALDVSYRFSDQPDGVLVEAAVALRRRRGLTAHLLTAALAALLNAGALGSALRRLEATFACPCAELAAA